MPSDCYLRRRPAVRDPIQPAPRSIHSPIADGHRWRGCAKRPSEHGVLIRSSFWNRLVDVPVLDDLSVFEFEDVSDGAAASAGGWPAECLSVLRRH